MVFVSDKTLKSDQGYEARGVIAKIERLGFYDAGGVMQPYFKYITLDLGKGRKAKPVKYIGRAPTMRNLVGESFLDLAKLKAGDIVVQPGFVYRETHWTTALHAEHLKALKNYRRKEIVKAEAPDKEEAVDLGFQNLSSETILEADHAKRKTLH